MGHLERNSCSGRAKIKAMVRTQKAAAIPAGRLVLLFVLFFAICCGLGYPILNRIDWRQAPGGLDDVQVYAAMVMDTPKTDAADHTRFRVLTPSLARPIYRIGAGHTGSWDPAMFALLVVNGLFVAGTVTVLMAIVNAETGSYATALGAALLYLLNFAVPNLRLVGMIDAGEAFFFVLVIWGLAANRYWTLPLWSVLGATAKESFVPFLVVFTLVWWISSRKKMANAASAAGWIGASWIAGLCSIVAVQWQVTGHYQSLLQFGLGLHQNSAYMAHLAGSMHDRNLWYIFVWLLPVSLVRVKVFPRSWRVATVAACAMAFVLDAFYGGPPGAIGRALFTVAGPLLCASAGLLLFQPNMAEECRTG